MLIKKMINIYDIKINKIENKVYLSIKIIIEIQKIMIHTKIISKYHNSIKIYRNHQYYYKNHKIQF